MSEPDRTFSSLPRWSEVTAIFGGRFDPPHLGHREAVWGLFQNPGIKNVRVIPSASPPHKTASASPAQRADLTRLNFRGHPDIQIDLREIERARIHPQIPSYTYDTLVELRHELPNLAFVIGADQLERLPTWHRFHDLLGLSHWIILERMPHGSDTARAILQEWKSSGLVRSTRNGSTWEVNTQKNPNRHSYLTICSTQAADLSSTRIRESIAKTGQPPANSLLPDVLEYLKDGKLYGI